MYKYVNMTNERMHALVFQSIRIYEQTEMSRVFCQKLKQIISDIAQISEKYITGGQYVTRAIQNEPRFT